MDYSVSTQDTNNNKIYSKEKSSHWAAIAFGLIFTAITIPFYEEIIKGIEKGDYKVLFILVFPLAGLYMAKFGWKKRNEFKAIGVMPLTPSPTKGQIGGQVGGSIELAVPWKKRTLTTTLSCIHTYTTNSGENTKTKHDVLWQEHSKPIDKPSGAGSLIEFCFDVPADLPVDGQHLGKGSIYWEIKLEGDVNNISLERHWRLPVEAGTGQSSIVISDAHKAEQRQENIENAKENLNIQVGLSVEQDTLSIESEINRSKSKRFGIVLFGLIFFSVGLFLLSKAIEGELMLWFMAPIFSLVGLIISGFGLYLMNRKLESKLINGTLYVRRSFLGYVVYRHQGGLTEASQVTLKKTSSSQQGTTRTDYYSVLADIQCDDGKQRSVKIAEGIAGLLVAEEMQRQVFKAMMY